MKPPTKVLIPLLSAAVLVGAPALASAAKAPRAKDAATNCPYKVSYNPLMDTVTRSAYIDLKPNRVDTITSTQNVTTSYRWTWKPLKGAKICEFSYTQNGVLKHPKIIRDPSGGTYSVTFPWRLGVGEERVLVTARL